MRNRTSGWQEIGRNSESGGRQLNTRQQQGEKKGKVEEILRTASNDDMG